MSSSFKVNCGCILIQLHNSSQFVVVITNFNLLARNEKRLLSSIKEVHFF